jgi:outer membrane protein TolC
MRLSIAAAAGAALTGRWNVTETDASRTHKGETDARPGTASRRNHRTQPGDSGSSTHTFGPSISWAAFDIGRVQARIRAARANADAELAAYQRAVLAALQETEGALVSYGRSAERTHTLELATSASDKAARLARQRYEAGLSDFLNVLDAEREALSAETSLAQSRTETATDSGRTLQGPWRCSGRTRAHRERPRSEPQPTRCTR